MLSAARFARVGGSHRKLAASVPCGQAHRTMTGRNVAGSTQSVPEIGANRASWRTRRGEETILMACVPPIHCRPSSLKSPQDSALRIMAVQAVGAALTVASGSTGSGQGLLRDW